MSKEYTNPTYYLQIGGEQPHDLLDPQMDDLSLDVIVKGLCYLNRFNGQAGAYSVAQHCVLGCEELRRQGASEEVQLAFLFHDAHEFITGDMPAPIKRIPWLKEAWNIFETIHADAMEEWVGVPIHSVPAVRAMDMAMVNREADVLLGGRVGNGWPPDAPADVEIEIWSPLKTEAAFIHHARRLGFKK